MGKNNKKTAKLRDFFNDPKQLEMRKFVRNAPNDLTLILLISSSLEVALEQLLLRTLVKGCGEDIFKHNGPLGSFSARIEMAYALGLIAKNEYKILGYIRKIRNRFAHSGGNHELTFEDDQIKDWVEEALKQALIPAKRPNRFENASQNHKLYVSFITLAFSIQYRTVHQASHATPTQAIHYYGDALRFFLDESEKLKQPSPQNPSSS